MVSNRKGINSRVKYYYVWRNPVDVANSLPEKFNKNVRMPYTFADPVDVVLSLLHLYDEHGEAWMREHYDHLKVPYTNFNNIMREDQLQLENHLNTWLNEDRFPIAFVKYESMWDHQDDISEFLVFPVNLSLFRKRNSGENGHQEILPKIEETYAALRKKFYQQKDFFIN